MSKVKTDKRLPASERREIILDVARSTFIEYGYEGAHMDLIAERAGVTKPILYRHFPGKLDLLLSVLDQDGIELLSNISLTRSEEVDWRKSIALDVKAYLDFVESHKEGYVMIYSSGVGIDRKVAERVALMRDSVRKIIAEHIRYYVDTDTVPPEDIDFIAAMVAGMTETAAMHWVRNEEIQREVCERNLIRGIESIMVDLPSRKM
ncbi:MAG: TetR/AcrR family transcriptional regulator [Actinobacteria bacterium]|nr:TetR/AcrR family transcriptional regulator [Actinomycetota bacterium]